MKVLNIDFPGLEVKKKKKAHIVYFNRRKVGTISQGTFWKTPLDPKKHIYRKWNSVGIEAEIISYLRTVGVKKIALSFDGGKSWYKIGVREWEILRKELEYGGKVQLHVELDYIKKLAEVVYYEDWRKGKCK